MVCPNCRSVNIHVLKPYKGETVKRRRECFDCGYRFNTIERYIPDDKENSDENIHRSRGD